MQLLIMPFAVQMILCGYKNANYRKYWKYDHYGVDISTLQGGTGDDHKVYASGNGTVVTCGFDNSGGNVIVINYPQVYNHQTRQISDMVARYMHLASIAVRPGQIIQRGMVLGVEGNTRTGDCHLHLEFDTDTRYPLHSPQVSGADDEKMVSQGNILLHGPLDSSVNPSHVLHVGNGQRIVAPTYNPSWLNPEDNSIPLLTINNDHRIEELEEANKGLITERDILRDQLEVSQKRLVKVKDFVAGA